MFVSRSYFEWSIILISKWKKKMHKCVRENDKIQISIFLMSLIHLMEWLIDRCTEMSISGGNFDANSILWIQIIFCFYRFINYMPLWNLILESVLYLWISFVKVSKFFLKFINGKKLTRKLLIALKKKITKS